jgi:hypothetical protein
VPCLLTSALTANDTSVYATIMYQYLVPTKLVDTCIVVVANQPKKPVIQGAHRDAGVG